LPFSGKNEMLNRVTIWKSEKNLTEIGEYKKQKKREQNNCISRGGKNVGKIFTTRILLTTR
jgi:hypothetical protein